MSKARRKIIKKKNIRNYIVDSKTESKLETKKKLDEIVDEALRTGLKINYLKKSRRKT